MPSSNAPFPWDEYRDALVQRGLGRRDAATLLARAGEALATFAGTGVECPPLLPLLQARLDAAAWSTLFDGLVDAQARGPVAADARAA